MDYLHPNVFLLSPIYVFVNLPVQFSLTFMVKRYEEITAIYPVKMQRMSTMLPILLNVSSIYSCMCISAQFWRLCMQSNAIVVCSFEAGVSETWNSKSCKCDCEGGESPSEFPSIRTGSSVVRGENCMPGIYQLKVQP